MKHKLLTVVMAVLLVTTAFGGTALAQTGTPTETPVGTETTQEEQADNNTTTEAPPGLQIAAMMGSIEREIDASMERFEMARELRMAENDSERQAILDSYLDRQSEKADAARSEVENNSKNKSGVGQYKSAMSVVDARNAAQNAEFAQEQAKEFGVGVNESKVEQLRQNANEMSGQEVSALARSLAGPPAHANAPDHAGPPERDEDDDDRRGPPEHAGEDDNETDDDVVYNLSNVSDKVSDARAAYEEANASGNYSNETLAEAEEAVVDAEEALDAAENASTEEAEQDALEDAFEAAEEVSEELESDADDDGVEDAEESETETETEDDSSDEQATNASEQGA